MVSPLRSICGMTRYWATPPSPTSGEWSGFWGPGPYCAPATPYPVRPAGGGATTRRVTGTNGGQKPPDQLTGRWGNMRRIRVATLATAALMLVPASGATANPRHHHHH